MGCGRKAAESFGNMKARIRTSKIQPIYLQCEDVHRKAKLKLYRQKKEITWHLSKMMSKRRGENFEGTGRAVVKRKIFTL